MLTKKSVDNIIYIWKIVGKEHRWKLLGLFFLMMFSVFSEMLSLGALVPFLTVLTNPDILLEKTWFKPIIGFLKVSKSEELLIPITIIFVSLVTIAALNRVLLLWVNTRLYASMSLQIRTEVYKKTLYRSYQYHLQNNTSDLISVVTEKIVAAINSSISHVLQLCIAFLTSIGIIVTLLFINVYVALISFGVLSFSYILVAYLSNKILTRNGKILSVHQPLSIQQLQEGIGGIRDVILEGTQEEFIKNYKYHLSKNVNANMNNSFISQLPKPIIELMGILLIVGLAFWLQYEGQNSLPVLGALALGAQRLLPSFQQIYNSWSFITANQAIVNDVKSYLQDDSEDLLKNHFKKDEYLNFSQQIELKNIGFSYNSTTSILEGINLKISKTERIGIIGATGSGKSTLVDIIMGLLEPSKGTIAIDTIVLDKKNQSIWRKNIAHVPQSIYLSDTSILENIAFGVSKDEIDMERVKISSKQACLDDFIESLDNGYQTYVGERGVQLSGGQRQRIGIARALYKNVSLLVLDEATSALDDTTEKRVMQNIETLNPDLTIIMIAHRVSTLRNCNVIYQLSQGKIIKSGDYNTVCNKEVKNDY